MKYFFFSILSLLAIASQVCIGSTETDDPFVLSLDGKEGPGQGKLVVLVSGDEEYRTEESMPMLAKILAEKHGFSCKVLFSWDEGGTYIDPDNHQGVRGWHYLDNADLMIIGTRFRNPSPEDTKHITRFLNASKTSYWDTNLYACIQVVE